MLLKKNNNVKDFPIGILDAKILFVYSGGRSKTPHFTGYFANIKDVALKHKSKIKGKENSNTEFYYEAELESNFKKNKKLSAQLNPNELLDSKDKKNLELFKNFLPSFSTLSKVMRANSIELL